MFFIYFYLKLLVLENQILSIHYIKHITLNLFLYHNEVNDCRYVCIVRKIFQRKIIIVNNKRFKSKLFPPIVKRKKK